jgi:acetoacetate decarboxylase
VKLTPDVFSTPIDAPLVPAFPVGYRDVTILSACYRTDPAAIAHLVPEPLQVHGDVVMVHCYDMPDVDHFGHVHECNVMVGVVLDGAPGSTAGYTTLLVNDSDGAMALGREVHGQPKKLGEVSLEVRGDLVVGTLRRNGIDVVTVTTPYKTRRAGIEGLSAHFDFARNVNLKIVPGIDGSLALAQLTERRLGGVRVHESWVAPCSVELRPNLQAPVWRLPVIEPLDAYWWRADFELRPGSVLHDYLAAGATGPGGGGGQPAPGKPAPDR